MGVQNDIRKKFGLLDMMCNPVLNQGTTKNARRFNTSFPPKAQTHSKSRAKHGSAPEKRPVHLWYTFTPGPIPYESYGNTTPIAVFHGEYENEPVDLKEKTG